MDDWIVEYVGFCIGLGVIVFVDCVDIVLCVVLDGGIIDWIWVVWVVCIVELKEIKNIWKCNFFFWFFLLVFEVLYCF